MSFFPPQSGQERSSTSATNSAPQSRQRARPASVSTRRGTPSYSVPSVTATQQSVRKRGTTPESVPTRTVMRLLAGDIAHHFEHRVAQCQLVHYLLTAFFTMLPARLTTPSATLIGMVSYEPACQSRTFLRWMASNLHFVVHRPQPMHR